MEAKRVDGIGEEPGDQIVVSASPGEWLEVIGSISLEVARARRGNATEDLVYWLINQGVYGG